MLWSAERARDQWLFHAHECSVARSSRRGDDARRTKARFRARARAGRAPRSHTASGRGPRSHRGGEHLRHRSPHPALGPVVVRARQPAADAGSRALWHGRGAGEGRARGRPKATTSPRRATSPAGCASTVAPARRTCASARRSSASIATAALPTSPRSRPRSSGRTTARSCRRRSRASRSRSATPSSPRRRRISRDARSRCSAVGRSGSSRSRSRGRSGAGRLLASDHVALPTRPGAAAWRRRGRQRRTRSTMSPAWFAEQNEGVGMGVVFEMSGALKAIEDAFGIVRHGGNVVLFGIPARPADDRHRRGADLQEPDACRRSTDARSGRRGTRRAGCSSTASSTSRH